MSGGHARYRAVIFDLDGVLVDSEPAHRMASRLLVAPADMSDEEYDRFVGSSLHQFAAWVHEHYRLGETASEVAQRYDQLVRAQVLALRLPPMDGVVELLAALRERSVAIALASQSLPEWVDGSLTGAGLSGIFPVVVTASMVDRPKPAPDIYLHTAASLGIAPAHCLVVEDSRPGVAAALAAGMTVIQTQQGSTPAPAQHGVAAVITSLRDFDLEWIIRGLSA